MDIFKYDEIPWTNPDTGGDTRSRGIKTKKLAQGEGGFFVGTSAMPPGLKIDAHSHNVDELFIVLEGGCTIDNGRRLSANDFVVIPANQVYGFTVGHEGMRFAVVRTAVASLEYAEKPVGP